MPRKVHNSLTPLQIKSAKPGRYADGGGLYLRVQGSGSKSWLFRAMIAGKAKDVGLGPAVGPGALSLAQARLVAQELALKVARGESLEGPRAVAKKAAAEAQRELGARKTFQDVAEAFVDLREGGWRNDKHRQQWRNTLKTYAYPHFGNLPVAEVETSHVMAALTPIWASKPETASRVRGRIENVLDAAKVQGLRSGENPARWRGHLDHLLSKRPKHTRGNHAAMPYLALPQFMIALREREAVAALALEFTILTAARTGEVLGATWGEIDLDAAVWTIPGARMKAGKEHRVPLSERALAILTEVSKLRTEPGSDAIVFPSGQSRLSGMAMAMLLRRMGVTDATVHGFRSTFRDWAAECTLYSHEVCEMALAHTIGNKAEAAYRRGDLFEKRRSLMADWADFVGGTEHSANASSGGPSQSVRN